jgi:phosphoribosylformylglycinamidine synthase
MVTRIKISIMPKESVLDPQGVAVRQALHHLGAAEAVAVRVGKTVELDWEGPITTSDEKLNRLCRDLLSNPVIEDYRIEIAN